MKDRQFIHNIIGIVLSIGIIIWLATWVFNLPDSWSKTILILCIVVPIAPAIIMTWLTFRNIEPNNKAIEDTK